MKFLKILTISVFTLVSTSLYAATIVDTGVITCDASSCGGATLYSDQSMAARFSLTSDTAITDIHAWVNSNSSIIGTTFTMAIYGDGGTIPNISQELFAQDVTVTNTGFEDNSENQWQGLSGLNLNLGPGSYWLSLEVRDTNDYHGYLPTDPFGALNPVDSYAFHYSGNGVWYEDSREFAFKIAGNVSAVPVPAAIWLFGSGVLGFLGIARRKTGITVR